MNIPHPVQPLIVDEYEVLRFKGNAIVRFLLDAGPFDMNQLALMPFTVEDREQFAQLIGYSLSGFGELSYVTDETYARAEAQNTGQSEEITEEVPTATSVQVARLRAYLTQLRQLSADSADLIYAMEKFAASHELLLSRYAKFHKEDRVALRITPQIDERTAPGWMGSKHFLKAGVQGAVRDVDVHDGKFYYQIVFDNESYIDLYGQEHPCTRRHQYCLSEEMLVDAPQEAQCQ